MSMIVDLNSDMGEGFGAWSMGADEALLDLVTSANIACGYHAGDPEIMAETFRLAKEKGVAIGAHPGYPDLYGFGRRRIPFSPGEVERFVAYQIGAAQALAAYAGHKLTYVKAHGALSNAASEDASLARAIAQAVKAVDPSLGLLAIALTELVKAGEDAGLATYQEIFADRGYTEEGQLISRAKPGALITDADEAAARVYVMVTEGAIISASGKRLKTPIHSICVHGDSAHAVEAASKVRARLTGAGITLRAFTG
jgi:5-oxoprolinase (ATP-hydrolysing) subunit A